MRRMRCLVAALIASFAVIAHGGVEAVKVTIASSLDKRDQPVGALDSITYPSHTYFHVQLSGLEPGRSYTARAVALDGGPNTLYDKTWTFTPTQPTWSLWHFYIPSSLFEPGEWKFALYIDSVPVAERSIQATRRPAAPPVAQAPALALVRATITSSLSRNVQPRRALESIRLPSAVYYYVEATGFVPGRNYQVRVTVLDGAKNVVGDHHFATEPRHADHVVWFPIIPRETHAPGRWTFRMYLGGSAPASQLVAETSIEASPEGGAARTAYLERLWPVAGIALVCLLVFLAYNLYAYGRAPPVAAAQAPPVRAASAGGVGRLFLDPSLFALVAANLFPLGLAIFAGANAADILFLYWVENFVVAAYTILRMVSARGGGGQSGGLWIAVVIFVLHFGLFSMAHAGILLGFFWDQSNLFELSPRGMLNPDIAAEFGRAPADVWTVVPVEFALQIAVLFISHGVSLVQNYLKGGEYLVATPDKEMMRPYNRVAVMHVAAIATGFLATSQGSPLALLVILVLLKTGVDVHSHVRSHASLPRQP